MKKLLAVLGLGIVVMFGYFTAKVLNIAPRVETAEYNINKLNEKLFLAYGDIDNLNQSFGAISIPDAPYLFITSLASGISTSDTSMTLNLGTLKDGTTLSGYQCFTIDTGLANAEYVCGTASGTAVSTLLRGTTPLNPAATSTSLTFSHRRGADVRITDGSVLQVLKRLNNGTDSFPNRLAYDSTIATSTFTTYNLVNKQYVDGVALQGAPTATTSVAGIVQIGNATQASSGTGMTGGYTLVPALSLFNSTPQSATTVPVTLANGKLAQGFLDLTQNFTFSGVIIHSATTTLATTTITNLSINGVSYNFPASQGSASSTLVNNGSGNLSWVQPFSFGTTTDVSLASSWNSTTVYATSTRATTTLATAQRVMVNYISTVANGTNGSGCQVQLFIDGVPYTASRTIGLINAGTAQTSLNFTYLTSQLNSGTHLFEVAGLSVVSGTCTVQNGASMGVIHLGN